MKHRIKKTLALFLSVVMIVTAVVIPSAFVMAEDSKDYAEGELIAVLKNSADGKYMTKSYARSVYGSKYELDSSFTFGSEKSGVKVAVLKSKSLTTKQMLRQVKNNPGVEYAFPNYKAQIKSFTNDTYSDYQWALSNTGQNGGTPDFDTNPETQWENVTSSSEEQVVAIVDTGIDLKNSELKNVLWNNPYGKKLIGKHGLDFTGTTDDGEPMDDNGHGTHCAGIIAAQADNNTGISGINKNKVKIMALKFLDSDGSGYTADALAAYEYIERAVKLGTNVIACNNSWGGMGDEEELKLFDSIFDELGKLGVITFAAAGNESSNISDGGFSFFDDELSYDVPACSKSKYCVTVAAANENDELAGFSNYSEEDVDIAAPGTDILSTVSYNCFNPTIYSDAQKSILCKDYQSYNSPLSEDSFGYMKQVSLGSSEYTDGTKATRSLIDGFGIDGKALKISFDDITEDNDDDDDDDDEEEETYYYVFEVPFTLQDANENYSVSFMAQCNNGITCLVYDVPAATSAKSIIDDEETTYFWGTEIGNYWDHTHYDIDMEDTPYNYDNAKNRKLIFVTSADSPGSYIAIDDLAISSQGVDTSRFGKYDFYNGTSMATPYATGAAALIKCATPTSSTADIINIIKNAGRHSDALEGFTETAKVLSLDNIDKIPPMISDVKYNSDGNVEITGSFRNINKVMINLRTVTPIYSDNGKIIVSDNNYSSRKLTVKVFNDVDSDTFETMISKKPSFDVSEINKAPDVVDAITVPTRDKAYFVESDGKIGYASFDNSGNKYTYTEVAKLDIKKFFDDSGNYYVSGAALEGSRMYLSVISLASSQYSGQILGYETAFGYVDLVTNETKFLCEIPDDISLGASLAQYNGDMYLIGGYDTATQNYQTSVFKFNADKNEFEKTSLYLPEGRAYTSFLQYGDKLFGVGGACETNGVPDIIMLSEGLWTKYNNSFESDDAISYDVDAYNSINVFPAHLGYGENGILVNGSFIYDIGDTYIINGEYGSVTAVNANARNSMSDNMIVGTTVDGSFIGFAEEYEAEGEASVGARSLSDGSGSSSASSITKPSKVYTLKIKNSYNNAPTGHTMTFTPAKAATYSAEGNNAYYYCPVCKKYFKDEAGTRETTPEAEKINKLVAKKANTLKVRGKTVKINLTKLKKKNQTVSLKKAMTVSGAQGTVTYKKLKGNKKISVNKKNGKITVKKGLKKKTYKVTVQVKASGNSAYKAATKKATVTIKVQ